eukprot:g32548.t1
MIVVAVQYDSLVCDILSAVEPPVKCCCLVLVRIYIVWFLLLLGAVVIAGSPLIALRSRHSRLALITLRSCRKSAGCRSQRLPRRLRSRTSGAQYICAGGTESCACAQQRTPDNNGLTVGHVPAAAGALSRAGRLDPGAAMKWSGSFRLLLMLWLTAPSGQRVVPARASPSHAESTQSDGDTASLMIEADDEEGDN